MINMKNSIILSFTLLVSILVNAQNSGKSSINFDCNEIKFWTNHLVSNFNDFTFIPNKDDSEIFNSKRFPYEFESCFFLKGSQLSEDRSLKASSIEFKTEKEAGLFFKKIELQLETCFKDQKPFFDKEFDYSHTLTVELTSQKGFIICELVKEEIFEMKGDNFTDKIIGYQIKLKMEFRNPTNEEVIEIENPDAKFDSLEVSFWEEAVRDHDIYGNFSVEYVGEDMRSIRKPTSFETCVLQNSFYSGNQKAKAFRSFETLQEAELFFQEANAEINNCLISKKFQLVDVNSNEDVSEFKWSNYTKKFNEKGQETNVSLGIVKRYNLEDYSSEDGFFVIFELEYIHGELDFK